MITDGDLTGIKFGKLTALRLSDSRQHNRVSWDCLCDCGNLTTVAKLSLKTGKTTSCGCLKRLPKGESGLRLILREYKKSAKKRHLEFSLEEELFFKIVTSDCYYCGSNPSRVSKPNRHGEIETNGIDRLDSSLGYTEFNVVPCCKQCNYAKLKMDEKQFYTWAERLCSHLKKNGKIK